MTVILELPAELELPLRKCAAANEQDLSDFIRQVVAESVAASPETGDNLAAPAAIRDYQACLQRIIDRHAGSGGRLDDSRESIYAGCGE